MRKRSSYSAALSLVEQHGGEVIRTFRVCWDEEPTSTEHGEELPMAVLEGLSQGDRECLVWWAFPCE